MRIIAGEFRGRVLKSPLGHKTRPTSDRLRETLFNILNPFIHDQVRFLDLCAGTGAVGIEALSRAAAFSVFVDKSRKACQLISENLRLLDVSEDRSAVICEDAKDFLARANKISFDFVFYDPPYQSDYHPVLNLIADRYSEILSTDAIVIVEHHFKNELSDSFGKLKAFRQVKQGETCLTFFN